MITNKLVLDAKSACIEAGLGICSLDEAKLLERLEALYWNGFKAGVNCTADFVESRHGEAANDQPG